MRQEQMQQATAITALFSALLLFAATASAQSSLEQRREDVRRRIAALRVWKLTEALNLSEARAARFFPAWREADTRTREITRQIRLHRRALASQHGLSTREIEGHLDALDDLLAQRARLESEKLRVYRKILSPEQVAILLIEQPRIDAQIRDGLATARRRAKPGRHKEDEERALQDPFFTAPQRRARPAQHTKDEEGVLKNPFEKSAPEKTAPIVDPFRAPKRERKRAAPDEVMIFE
jgi:hypothetical protein